MQLNKKFDIVLWGATGFTGQLCADYLAKFSLQNQQIKIAIAGRSQQKLNEIQLKMNKINNNICFEQIIANSDNMESLNNMTKQTKVIITTVGPYALYGTKLVESCINNQTHYVDLTGEGIWVKEIIDKYHQKAQQNKVKIIPSCGFDSIPSDISVLQIAEYLKQKNIQFQQIRGYLIDAYGGVSGGTLASLRNMFETNNYNNFQNQINDPQYLNPQEKKNGFDKSDQISSEYDNYINSWTSPFIMSLHNTRIVRRSNAILNYNNEFNYSETQLNKNRFTAYFSSSVSRLTNTFFYYSLGRWFSQKILPAPGQGPSEEVQKQGFYQMQYLAINNNKIVAKCDFIGVGDPGYSSTSKILSECALCLVLDIDKINDNYGVITPASGIGMPLIPRLKNAGIKIIIRDI